MYHLMCMYRRLLATTSHLGFYVLHYGSQYFNGHKEIYGHKEMFLIKAVFNFIFLLWCSSLLFYHL